MPNACRERLSDVEPSGVRAGRARVHRTVWRHRPGSAAASTLISTTSAGVTGVEAIGSSAPGSLCPPTRRVEATAGDAVALRYAVTGVADALAGEGLLTETQLAG